MGKREQREPNQMNALKEQLTQLKLALSREGLRTRRPPRKLKKKRKLK